MSLAARYGAAIRKSPRRSPAGEIASCALSSSAAIRAACSRKVAPASVSTAPCVVRDRSWTPSACSSRASRRLAIDFDTPSLRAAGETPPASATSRNVRTSPRSKGVPPSVSTDAVVSELHRTWRRPEAAEIADIYTVHTPNYRAVMESYQSAKEVGSAAKEPAKQLQDAL